MKKRVLQGVLFLLLLLPLVGSVGAQSQKQPIDFRADLAHPIKIGDSSVTVLVGDVVFVHNGAVISCDSAVRYNSYQMDCFNNVIINKDSTYIYGDKVSYDGTIDQARVSSPLVKMIDKDALLYTYQLIFDTKTKVGRYSGGGTMLQRDNRMESERGYYYVDERLMVGVDRVQMQNDEYKMISDSVAYNLDTQVATFYTESFIWNNDNDFLKAERGEYDRAQDRYTFSKASYVLTPTQEIWADSIIYEPGAENLEVRGNLQADDQEQQLIAFGDYGRYWGKERKMLLTRNPAIVNYDAKEDTLYMRADSMFLYTYRIEGDSTSIDSLAVDSFAGSALDSLAGSAVSLDSLGEGEFSPLDSLAQAQAQLEADSTAMEQGSVDSVERSARQAKLDKKRLKAQKRNSTLSDRQLVKEQQRKEARKERDAKRKALKAERYERALEVIKAFEEPPVDSTAILDSLAAVQAVADSLAQIEQLRLDSLERANERPEQDSLYRVMHAYRNVKIFRNDFQAVCDSVAGYTLDSMMTMYYEPVLWNEENQITSEEVEIYSRHKRIDRAIFIGDPIMGSMVSETAYNQIKGKEIETIFEQGVIDRTEVMGNGQTYYYLVEEDSTRRDITGFMTVECADITFKFKDQTIDQIVWRGDPNYVIYPIDKVSEDVSQVLDGFSWEGDRRPSRVDVFDRVIRPSARLYYQTLTQPGYPITRGVDRKREELVGSGLWYDREERLSEEVLRFLNTL